jgi:hypothetical protein
VSRPADWAPLADADPVPGDEAEIRLVAKRYRDFAAELEEQAAVLTRVAHGDGWDCGAQRAFAQTATEISGQLTRVKGRYQSAGDALDSYATQLTQAQAEADAALREAKQAESDAKAKAAAGTPTPIPHPAGAGPDGGVEMTQALAGPRDRLRRAVEHRDHAGQQAANRVREAIDHDGLQDSWWDKVKDWSGKNWDSFLSWVHEHADVIDKIATRLSNAASIIAIVATVLSFIPVVDALAPILFSVSAGLTVVCLGLHLMLALSGDGSWLDVGLDVVALATFGWGKAATGMARGAQGVLKEAAGAKALSGLRVSNFGAVAKDFAGSAKAGVKITAGARSVMDGMAESASQSQAAHVVGKVVEDLGPKAAKVAQSGFGRGVNTVAKGLLGKDAEVVVETAQHQALAAFDPKNPVVEQALKKAVSGVKQGEIADLVGLADDIADKSHVGEALGVKQALTFGRYATS